MLPGETFGDYEIIRCIGVGGMGSVYEANHRLMNRRVALKVLHASMPRTSENDSRARFVREGMLLVRIQHSNVVSVYDAGSVGTRPYLAMELLEGGSFDRLGASSSSKGSLSPERIVKLIVEAAEGLSAAHLQGIVHRDVKPENIFVAFARNGAETAKIVDFGIAKDFRTSDGKNTAIGTPAYMSPEQLLGGRPIDGRCDQYALAVVLYEALTGERPYDAPSLVELAMALERGGARPPSARGAPTSGDFDAVVMRALSVDPEARFATMAEFAEALRLAAQSGIGDAFVRRPTNDSDRPTGFEATRPIEELHTERSARRLITRQRLWAIALSAVLLIACALAAFLFVTRTPPSPSASEQHSIPIIPVFPALPSDSVREAVVEMDAATPSTDASVQGDALVGAMPIDAAPLEADASVDETPSPDEPRGGRSRHRSRTSEGNVERSTPTGLILER